MKVRKTYGFENLGKLSRKHRAQHEAKKMICLLNFPCNLICKAFESMNLSFEWLQLNFIVCQIRKNAKIKTFSFSHRPIVIIALVQFEVIEVRYSFESDFRLSVINLTYTTLWHTQPFVLWNNWLIICFCFETLSHTCLLCMYADIIQICCVCTVIRKRKMFKLKLKGRAPLTRTHTEPS